jgi:hypothetical protein
VFDDTKRVVEEAMRNIEKQRVVTKEQIADAERQLKQIDNNLDKFEAALDGADIGTTRVIARRIDDLEGKKTKCVSEVATLKIVLETLNEKYSDTELKATYYSVKDRLIDFFERYDTLQKRNELIRVIEKSELHGHYLTIGAGKKLFVFDMKERHAFGGDYLEKLKKDEVYLANFLGMQKPERLEAVLYKDRIVSDWVLSSDYHGVSMREIIGDYLLERGVGTNLTGVDEVVSFIETSEYVKFLTKRFVLRRTEDRTQGV